MSLSIRLKRLAPLPLLCLSGAILLPLCFFATAIAADLTLAWDPVGVNDLAGYKLHYGTASRQYSNVINVGKTVTRKVSGLAEGQTWYFAVTAFTTQGRESDYSKEVSVILPTAKPANPSNPGNPSAPAPKTLTSIAINGPGTVPGGSSTTFTCRALYSDHSTATVTPTWSSNNSCAKINPNGLLTTTPVAVNQTVTLTAGFQGRTTTQQVVVQKAAATVQLTIQQNGSGQVTTIPASTTHKLGTTVKLYAFPDTGWLFDGWSGMVTDSEASISSIYLNADHWIAANFVHDQDRDGVSDMEESGRNGLNPNFDGNGDGVPDCLQAHVTSLFSYTGGYYVTLQSSLPTKFTACRGLEQPKPGQLPKEHFMKMGVFNLQLTDVPRASGRAGVTFTLPANVDGTTAIYYAYGPTPDNRQPHWYPFMYNAADGTGAVIKGQTVTIHYKDGARGDDDLTVNGRILSQTGPLVPR